MTEAEFEDRLSLGEAKGWVYFAASGEDGPVKIGWAKDPEKRLHSLQTGHPEELDLIALIPGTRHLEADIHRRLWKSRLRGEWFDRSATMRLVRPVVSSHGLFLTSKCSESRTIPGTAKWSAIKKREFFVSLQGDR